MTRGALFPVTEARFDGSLIVAADCDTRRAAEQLYPKNP
jgi:hypothetical protein